MIEITYRSASCSHVGLVRELNEDAFLELPSSGLWAVADGMGGHTAGDYVASLIVDSLRRFSPPDSWADSIPVLHSILAEVNVTVREETLRRNAKVMGSTVLVFATCRDQGVCLWAGDSRLYRQRDGVLEAVSRDHSYVQQLQDSGLINEAEARVHPQTNLVTRAVGVEKALELAQINLHICPGDTYLLCTDGLNKTVEDTEMSNILDHPDPEQIVRSLVHLGLTRGAPDNITAIVVKAFKTCP
jgi:serine/threonine-protein phosphatase Stp1